MKYKYKHNGLAMQMCAGECDTLVTINLPTYTTTARSFARQFGQSRSSGRSGLLMLLALRGPITSGGTKLRVQTSRTRIDKVLSEIDRSPCSGGSCVAQSTVAY